MVWTDAHVSTHVCCACVKIRKPLSSIGFLFLSCGIWGTDGTWASRHGSKCLYLVDCLTSPAAWFFSAVQYSDGTGRAEGLRSVLCHDDLKQTNQNKQTKTLKLVCCKDLFEHRARNQQKVHNSPYDIDMYNCVSRWKETNWTKLDPSFFIALLLKYFVSRIPSAGSLSLCMSLVILVHILIY